MYIRTCVQTGKKRVTLLQKWFCYKWQSARKEEESKEERMIIYIDGKESFGNMKGKIECAKGMSVHICVSQVLHKTDINAFLQTDGQCKL